MIPLELFDYSAHKKIDIDVTKYVNRNLASIVHVVIDFLNEDSGFDMEGLLPRDYLERKPQECRRLVDELYEIIDSDAIRDYIKPKYEYLLYAILSWWDDCTDEESDLIPISLNNDLLQRIKNEESYISEDNENIILEYITSYDSYYYICFYDHDFLPEQISAIITLYLKDPNLFKSYYPDMNLEDYEDLMPCDLRELYFEESSRRKSLDSNIIAIEQGIIFELASILQSLEQRIVEIEKRDEVEISNDIYSILNRILKVKFGLETTREMTIGRANLKLGETDLYIYKNDSIRRTDYAIIENKLIENFIAQYQQLLGYLNHNFKFGITISINKKLRLTDAITNIKDTLCTIKEKDVDFKITNICVPYGEFPYVIRSSHIIPEDPTKEMPIYHMILNLYDAERKKIAKIARKK